MEPSAKSANALRDFLVLFMTFTLYLPLWRYVLEYLSALGIDLRPQIFALARERGWVLRELTRSRHSLEDIYVRVTRPDDDEEEV